jgi:hypothetical protein
MKVVTGRTVFDAGGNGFSVACPACRTGQRGNYRWGDAVQDWCDGNSGALTCPTCRHSVSVTQWVYDPVWGGGFAAAGAPGGAGGGETVKASEALRAAGQRAVLNCCTLATDCCTGGYACPIFWSF